MRHPGSAADETRMRREKLWIFAHLGDAVSKDLLERSEAPATLTERTLCEFSARPRARDSRVSVARKRVDRGEMRKLHDISGPMYSCGAIFSFYL